MFENTLKRLRLSEQLDNVEELETYNIIRFLSFVIYIEFVLRYFFITSFFNFPTPFAFYNFIVANWIEMIFVWIIYYPVQNLGKHVFISISRMFSNVFWFLRKSERKDYQKMQDEGFIIDLDVADEVVRRYADRKLEQEISQTIDDGKKVFITKMRLAVIFSIFLTNASLYWFGYSDVELMLKANSLQIFILLGLAFWIAYPEPETYNFVVSPRYLAKKEIDEIEDNNFFSRLWNERRSTTSVQDDLLIKDIRNEDQLDFEVVG